METKQESAKKYGNFNWNVPQIIASLPEGEDARKLFYDLDSDLRVIYRGNPNIKVISYDEESKSLVGSNIFAASRLDELLEPSGIRVAVPSDNRYGDIYRAIKGKFFTDFNAIILRTIKGDYNKNRNIAQDLADKVEQRQGKLKLPVMIVRPLVRYAKDSEGYNLVFELGKNTQVIEDKRLDGEKYPSGMKFDNVDDIGLPLFNEEGKLTWYARQNGISRLYLVGSGDLFSNDGDLAYSLVNGRVVLVHDEAA